MAIVKSADNANSFDAQATGLIQFGLLLASLKAGLGRRFETLDGNAYTTMATVSNLMLYFRCWTDDDQSIYTATRLPCTLLWDYPS